MKRLLLSLALAASVAACSTAPKTAPQTVYAAKSAFLVSLQVTNAYAALPRCPQPVLCSDQATINRAYTAAVNAKVALDAAEAIVTSAPNSNAALNVINNAAVAVGALQTITNGMQTK